MCVCVGGGVRRCGRAGVRACRGVHDPAQPCRRTTYGGPTHAPCAPRDGSQRWQLPARHTPPTHPRRDARVWAARRAPLAPPCAAHHITSQHSTARRSTHPGRSSAPRLRAARGGSNGVGGSGDGLHAQRAAWRRRGTSARPWRSEVQERKRHRAKSSRKVIISRARALTTTQRRRTARHGSGSPAMRPATCRARAARPPSRASRRRAGGRARGRRRRRQCARGRCVRARARRCLHTAPQRAPQPPRAQSRSSATWTAAATRAERRAT